MQAFYKFLMTRLVAWYSGLSADDFQWIINLVRRQDEIGTPGDGTGPPKAASVREKIMQAWTKLSPGMATWLIETALRYVRKTEG